MKYLVIIALALTACKSAAPAPPGPSGSLTGAASPREAVQLFMNASKAQDLQTMSAIWGTAKGPARDVLPRDQLEKREVIMQCYLGHDAFRILSDTRRNGQDVFQVSLTKGSLTRQTTVSAVKGPSNRWYVTDVALEPLNDICRASSSH